MLLTVVAIGAVVALVIALAGRGVWRSLAERWKFEGDVARRVSARYETAESDREAMKEQAPRVIYDDGAWTQVGSSGALFLSRARHRTRVFRCVPLP